MEIQKITDPSGHVFYKHADHRYSRLISGVAWPALKPGFVVVVAEDYYENTSLKCHHLRALAEAEESDIERLFKKSLDLRERYQVERTIGDVDNEPMMDLLYDFNKNLEGASSLSLYGASFAHDLRYQVSLIKGVTAFNSKILHIDQCNKLRGHLSSITVEIAQEGKASDHPAVIALGYVIAYVKNHPRDPVKDRIGQIPKEEPYDPLTFGLKP